MKNNFKMINKVITIMMMLGNTIRLLLSFYRYQDLDNYYKIMTIMIHTAALLKHKYNVFDISKQRHSRLVYLSARKNSIFLSANIKPRNSLTLKPRNKKFTSSTLPSS